MESKRERQARALAEDHYGASESIKAIYRLLAKDENARDEPIKLLEVNEETIPVGVEPLYFQPVPEHGINFPLVLVDITPNEFNDREIRKCLRKEFGWTIAKEAYRRPALAKAT